MTRRRKARGSVAARPLPPQLNAVLAIWATWWIDGRSEPEIRRPHVPRAVADGRPFCPFGSPFGLKIWSIGLPNTWEILNASGRLGS